MKKRADASTEAVDTLIRLLKGKADSYEIFYSADTGFGAESVGMAVDALKARSSAGVGLRVVSGGRQGFGLSSVLTKDALSDVAGKAVAGSAESSQDEYLVFAAPGKAAAEPTSLEVFDEDFYSGTEEQKISCAIRIEQAARALSPKIARVRKASYNESISTVRIVNSNGVDVSSSATYFSGSVTAVAEEGAESQMGWEIGMGHKRSGIDPEAIGRGAAQNALRMLGGRNIATVRCPAVIENTVACELLESLAGSFSAENVHKGKSMLAGKAGKKVVSSALNIIDDGLLRSGWASSPYDGEGTPSQTKRLIKDGVLAAYLYDTYWARRDGAASTGNAVRSSYKSLPGLGISNLYIEKGAKPQDELLREMGRGLFITEVMGVHTINTVSGDFSIGASGLWVEGGVAAYPVRGMAIAGNLLELFSKVAACGSNLRFIGSIGAPDILVSELEASGA